MNAHKLAVFGNPVSHSRSPEIHQAFARQAGIRVVYEKILAPLDGFESEVRKFTDAGGWGFNVTLPFKEQAFRLMAACSEGARASQAVNTVTIRNDSLIGDNTDGPGLVKDITVNLGWPLRDQRILILGAGGAVRGALWALLQEEPGKVDLFNRTPEKAEALVAHYGDARLESVTELQGDPYGLIINGTSAGLGGEFAELPDAVIGRDTRCYDMIYGSGTTPFNAWCRDKGARAIANGLGMLVEQAALSFAIWFEFHPETAPVIQDLKVSLENS